ncbi:MAG TPA: hypothetical protein VIF60_18880 [Burkholderiaceae bacterium]|jgi:hypothetical protein
MVHLRKVKALSAHSVKIIALLLLLLGMLLLPMEAAAIDMFDNTNVAAVSNCPQPFNACFPKFRLVAPMPITEIETYHWDNGIGAPAGSISLQNAAGATVGTFAARDIPGTNGVPANWVAQVNRVLPAGIYTIVDSQPATWSQNAQSQHKGFAIVRGGATAGAGTPPAPATAPNPVPCTFRNGFNFLCYGDVITLSERPVVFGTMLTLTVNPASGYTFDANTVIVLERSGGVGFGVGLLTLCGGLSGGAMAPACVPTGPKTLTVAVPAAGPIAAGNYLLRAENWNPITIAPGIANACNPTCTEADAGIVQFTGNAAGNLQITSVVYPAVNGQIGVNFVDPNQNINQVQVRPWMGYQWGNPVAWNPGASGMGAGELFIAIGCRPGNSYSMMIELFDASGQAASTKFNYTCR